MLTLEEVIGYQFSDALLLREALTHPSMAYESQAPCPDNQRLEFLGDAVIQLVLTERLYKMFPDFTEGQMTKLRARLVSRTALHQFAAGMDLGKHVMMGKGEEATGGRHRPSTLADAYESVMGAVYLDGGLEAAANTIETICSPWIEQLAESPVEKNHKGQLQEELQALAPESPCYEVLKEAGPDHQKTFRVCVEWKGLVLGEGAGNSKKSAEIMAAKDALRNRNWKNLPS